MARKPVDSEIIAKLDVLAEYTAMGIETVGRPGSNDWLSCWARERAHGNSPSAGINIGTDPKLRGRYRDLGQSGESLNFWEFAVKWHPNGFKDWREARAFFAAKAGIAISSASGKKAKGSNFTDHFVVEPWNDALAQLWCLKKQGVTVESLKANGAFLGQYPKKSKQFKVIGLYHYCPLRLDAVAPIGCTLWNLHGGTLPIYSSGGNGGPVQQKKCKCHGPHGIMGLWGIQRLRDAEKRSGISLVVKTEGPSDMLAAFATLPVELRERIIVFTNSNGSVENPADYLHLLAGLHVLVCHDADVGGENGVKKWSRELAGVAASVRAGRLPYEIAEKDGKDLRDFINSFAART